MDVNTAIKVPKLSVIIITRNEERNISRCIDAVLRAIRYIESTEVILVDSCSTDRTIEIASKYPIKIIQLQPSSKLSAGAGYYIGFKHSLGELVHFQCGDSLLDENWFKNAIPVLDQDSSVGGVAGIISQEPHGTLMAKDYANRLSNLPNGEAKWFMIDTFFKRSALLKAGSFNPHLRSTEEGELCYRIRDKGFKLVRLPIHMSHHLGCRENALSYLTKSLSYAVGYGQVLRYATGSRRIFHWRLNDFKFYFASLFLTAIFFIGFALLISLGFPMLVYIWIACSIFLLLWFTLERKDFLKAVMFAILIAVTTPSFLWGLLKPKKDPNTFPDSELVLKSSPYN